MDEARARVGVVQFSRTSHTALASPISYSHSCAYNQTLCSRSLAPLLLASSTRKRVSLVGAVAALLCCVLRGAITHSMAIALFILLDTKNCCLVAERSAAVECSRTFV